jgi:hypothetical protein
LFWSQHRPFSRLLLLGIISENFDLGVEVVLEAVLQLNTLAVGVGRNCQIEQPFVNNFVVIDIPFPLME